jgi:hypothetical protein
MARLAGMNLRERWSNWKREPFTSDSTSHVSLWEKGEDGVAANSGGRGRPDLLRTHGANAAASLSS